MIGQYRWSPLGDGYVGTNINGRRVGMHRLVMGDPIGQIVDHVNGDRRDNRKANLRVANPTLNNANRAKREGKKFKGPSATASGKFRAWGSVKNKTINLGTFATEEAAAAAYDAWAFETHGEFARLNFAQAAA